MATGERTFSTSGRSVVTPKAQLIPPGEYGLKLRSGADVGKADGPTKIPYVNCSFEAEGTATTEGGKNRVVFHRLLLGLKPGKDGVLNLDRPNGLNALAKALGTELEGVEIIEQTVTDENGNEVTLEYLNPRQVVEWVKSFEGTMAKGRVKIVKGDGQYADKNEVQRFSLPE